MTKKPQTEEELHQAVKKVRVVTEKRDPQTGHFTLELNGEPVPGTFSSLADKNRAKARIEAGFEI